ncbi:MBL fold metallo-hydrolase, partial [Chamaesiphon sp. OTE_8_metabat_110]|uniref:MBL fold metallo-hydrolase n=1 Tax=Chamaesiphon sp. OTE_8_metabat_110 TaxID=2964696 RepID=UPI00286C65AC
MSTNTLEISLEQYCEMTVSGIIAPDDRDSNKLVLMTPDGCQFRAAPLGDVSIGAGSRQWRVIPIMQTDGNITRLQIIEEHAPSALEGDRFLCVGRTNQVSRKHNTVSLKIERPGEPTIRPTLFDPPPAVKSGQLWQFVAQRVGMTLEIISAEQLDNLAAETVTKSLPSVAPKTIHKPRNPDNARSSEIKSLALAALNQELNDRDWELSLTRVKEPTWEWEAQSLVPLDLRARVQVNARTKVARVYAYPHQSTFGSSATLTDGETGRLGDGETGELAAEGDKYLDRLIVTPLGAARGIGASCFRVQIGPYEIVMDAGTRPKGSDPLPAFELLERPNLILITHAHLDHIGALPIFHRDFPEVPMICTHGTREIAHVMLTDGLKVQAAQQKQGNEDFGQVFTADDLDRTLFTLQTQPVGVDFSPLPGLTVRFIHAGHIVGAACIYMEYGNRSILYTGDYNTTSSRTAEGLKLADLPQADILITESTYGSDTHPSRRTQESDLIKAIVEVVANGGNVLIPAFALGRAQEIILAIRTSALFHSVNVPVYIDGLVREVTDLFQTQLDLLPAAVQNFA